ncbi:hypothetical protein ULMS_22110 [Patiriisocius marinistellae]|uniref:LysM domain-containing protein n=1 Tax=Patiriisocius marinistellae TaxID=2494560 RepID=A0A5J4FXC6_9FLAO|nr:hypothetical protein ULMS_22110 [Patiriisocius marinistellae]
MGCGAIAQEDYKTHTVQENETLASIAKDFSITVADIKRLNPNAGNEPPRYSQLVLPARASKTTKMTEKFKTHKVRRKETLFSISKKYEVSIEDIKRYNKELYSQELKKGEKIRIPVFDKSSAPVVDLKPVVTTVTGVSSTLESLTSHTVQPKETRYGIARMYGITLEQLESINPHIGKEGLSVNEILNVPAETIMPTAVPEEGYNFYQVLPKEGFYRLKVKTGLSKEEIVALNPYAKDGLKDGMILKMPMGTSAKISEEARTADLEKLIVNKDSKRVAVLLPFRLNKIESDTKSSKEDVLSKDGVMRLALDFYSGVLMASEFAKDKGISVQLDVFDTEFNDNKVGSIISSRNFEDFDAVIGPLRQKNVEKAAGLLKNGKVPVFSPLSNRDIKISKNVFQTLPSVEMMEDNIIQYIEEKIGDRNLIIISDSKRATQKNKLLSKFPNAKTASPRKEGFLYVQDVQKQINNSKENWVILESDDPIIVSNVVGVLNGMPAEYKLRLFTLDKNDAYDYNDVSNMNLAKLQFTFPSVSKSYNYNDKTPFLISYKNKYGVLPNRYAVRGFDVTYDVLLRLASADDVYEATEDDFETEYIENKFRYSKKFLSGYVNNAVYIIKYKDNLQFEVLK